MASILTVRIGRAADPTPTYPEIADKPVVRLEFIGLSVLEKGMESGRASVGFLVDLPDGKIGFLECSARQFEMAAAVVRGACKSWGEDNT